MADQDNQNAANLIPPEINVADQNIHNINAIEFNDISRHLIDLIPIDIIQEQRKITIDYAGQPNILTVKGSRPNANQNDNRILPNILFKFNIGERTESIKVYFTTNGWLNVQLLNEQGTPVPVNEQELAGGLFRMYPTRTTINAINNITTDPITNITSTTITNIATNSWDNIRQDDELAEYKWIDYQTFAAFDSNEFRNLYVFENNNDNTKLTLNWLDSKKNQILPWRQDPDANHNRWSHRIPVISLTTTDNNTDFNCLIDAILSNVLLRMMAYNFNLPRKREELIIDGNKPNLFIGSSRFRGVATTCSVRHSQITAYLRHRARCAGIADLSHISH
ncbi:MAG: hypothetical protein RLZ75_998, partial [Pseudomonadota bacterium]